MARRPQQRGAWAPRSLQPSLAAIGEGKPGSRDEIARRCSHEDLAGLGLRGYASCDMNGDPARCLATPLDLARVDAGADGETELRQAFPDGERAADRARRTVVSRDHIMITRAHACALVEAAE